jgi:hypothetical protein
MPNELSIDLSQNVPNQLTAIADQERARLIPKNDYAVVSNEYSSVNPNAIADGDAKGRGTGTFLDVYNQNAGNKLDIYERKDDIKINKFNAARPYPNFELG